MQSEEEYRQEYLSGLHQTDYNHCRFAEDKQEYCKQWLRQNVPWADFDNPKTIVDRICNYKVYDRDPRKALWADKIQAIYQLRDLGFNDLIIEPIMISRGPLTINDIKQISDGKWILRMNHGSGWNMKFTKSKNFNPNYLISKVKEWYSLNYAYVTGYESQYEHIIPGFVIQPDLGDLMNWEFWCENGKIVNVNLVRKIGKNLEDNIAFFDGDGNTAPWKIAEAASYKAVTKFQKETLEKMKPYVLKLAEDFNFVRVDLYSINKEIKFSELTFTPCGGRILIQGV